MADVHYNLGILLQNTQRWEEAIASYQAAIAFRPHLAAAHLNLGLALHRVGRGAEAQAALRACATLHGARTKDPRAHELARAACRFQLGRLAMDDGRPRDALRAFQDAVAAMPPHYQPQSLYNLMGEAHSRLGHDAEAERWFRAALSSKPDHVPAHLTYGRLLARNASRLREAERWYRRAEALAPEDASVFRHYDL
ncbi:Protein O-mannosyl-transferase TMTC2 [Gryllus bimaculatus]|nr:Protein O-mannosyl-transferase TMTC2 [Gryllus bimaculatus]